MTTTTNTSNCNRRELLKKTIIAGALLGFGCNDLIAGSKKEIKRMSDSGMTTEEILRFAFGNSIPIFQSLAKQLGKEKLIEMLEKASSEKISQEAEYMVKDIPDRDINSFAMLFEDYLSTPPFDKALSAQVVEKSEKVFEIKYTECLFAKIFREMGAADIGYTLECVGASIFAKTFNQKMTCKNPKNLMKGDDVCIERFELEV